MPRDALDVFSACPRCGSRRLDDPQGAEPEWTGASQRFADSQGFDYVLPADNDPPADYDPEPRHRFLLCLGRLSVWVNDVGDDVERFEQDLDEGLFDGIPRAISDPEWLTHYMVEWSGIMLRSGQKFSELGVPEGHTLNLYVVLCHHDSIVTRRLVSPMMDALSSDGAHRQSGCTHPAADDRNIGGRKQLNEPHDTLEARAPHSVAAASSSSAPTGTLEAQAPSCCALDGCDEPTPDGCEWCSERCSLWYRTS